MRIQTNVTAMNTHRMYTLNNSNVSKSAEKLSSGYRINRAGDDAAGLAISEKMRAQVKGLSMASKNSQDAISLIQTAEGALQEVHTMLQRMNELSVQSATGTNANFDRQQVDAEFTQLKNEINDIAKTTNFNNMKLLDGTLGGSEATASNATGTTNTLHANSTITSFAISGQSGLSDQVGTYKVVAATAADLDAAGITDTATTVNCIKVTFTEEGTGNVTNTVIDISKVMGGDGLTSAGAAKAYGSFSVDLSSAGMGTLELTNTTNAEQTAEALAKSLAGNGLLAVKGTSAGNGGLRIQVGAEEGDQLNISISRMNAEGLGLSNIGIADQSSASKAITATRSAIDKVSAQRATLGAMQNRLDYKISNLDNTVENLSAAESRIRDVDLAKEMTSYTKNNILSQASTAMLAQANAAPQNVLSLLQ